MTANSIARALKARRSGSCWMARCPAHDDSNPSLSIREADDGDVLVHCHAGCSQSAVVGALKELRLWPVRECNQPRTIAAEYNYTDETGTLLYQVVRYQPKDFRPRYQDGAGEWVYRKYPRQVLYHLPEVLENPIIFVCEGEKDVEKLREHGFVATTNAGGAKAPWLPAYTEALRGRECILVPDNDRAGWERVAAIAKALLGTAIRIHILDLPRQYKDVSDWFAAGHSECELIAIVEGVHAV